MPRIRADITLVQRGFFKSRAKAQEAIARGLVRVAGLPIRKPSELIDDDAVIEAQAPYPWVSRGGVKLDTALDHFAIDVRDQICLDIGASTGGFSDVLRQRGAAQIYAIDVGHGQLHEKLRREPRIISMEGTDARSLTPSHFARAPDMIVCDTSFISLKLILPHVLALAALKAHVIALIKPQFEAGPQHVVKGLVKDEKVRHKICTDIEALILSLGWTTLGLRPSPIEGGDGNIEYLIGARRP
jgi:23S rRNA (cytidine1920-2'-O)/16S rRNA (cytidine1409-2'-O)-methyltransferase